MKNYEDSKCSYGYMTVCDACAAELPNRISFSHVDTTKVIEGFPTEECEVCGKTRKQEKNEQFHTHYGGSKQTLAQSITPKPSKFGINYAYDPDTHIIDITLKQEGERVIHEIITDGAKVNEILKIIGKHTK